MRHEPDSRRRSNDVSASSLRALTSVGFLPLGVVFGNSTTHIARVMSSGVESRISTAARSFAGDDGSSVPNPILQEQTPHHDDRTGSPPFLVAYPCPHYGFGRTQPRRHVADHMTGYNWEIPDPGRALGECFANAHERMVTRATALGAHGIVDVQVRVAGDPLLHGNMEVTLAGTAVSVPGVDPVVEPFVAGISCPAVAKLVMAGLLPLRLSFGAALLSSWIGCQTQKELESGYAKEVTQLADVLTQAREAAITRVHQGMGESGAQVAALSVSHGFGKVSKTDFRVGAWAFGTKLLRFSPRAPVELAEVALTMEQR